MEYEMRVIISDSESRDLGYSGKNQKSQAEK
jgi:hypothetical protein